MNILVKRNDNKFSIVRKSWSNHVIRRTGPLEWSDCSPTKESESITEWVPFEVVHAMDSIVLAWSPPSLVPVPKTKTRIWWHDFLSFIYADIMDATLEIAVICKHCHSDTYSESYSTADPGRPVFLKVLRQERNTSERWMNMSPTFFWKLANYRVSIINY